MNAVIHLERKPKTISIWDTNSPYISMYILMSVWYSCINTKGFTGFPHLTNHYSYTQAHEGIQGEWRKCIKHYYISLPICLEAGVAQSV